MAIIASIILTILLIPVLALSESSPLEGTYWIDGKFLSDPPDNQKKDTHIYFTIEGSSAKDLYQLIDVKPVLNKCGVDHWQKRKERI